MRKKKNISHQVETAFIDNFSHEGRGIAKVNGKTIFIEGALPEETVTFRYTRQKTDFAEGQVVEVLKPSLMRVKPECPHYDLCGGCALQHLASDQQIAVKQTQLLNALSRIGHTQPESILPPLTSDPWHYRYKARLSVRYVAKKQTVLIGFREKHNPRYITDIDQCPILHQRVDAAIKPLQVLLNSFEDKQTIAQIEVAASEAEVALIFRNLAPLSSQDKEKLTLFADQTQFKIFLQPGNMESVTLFYPAANDDFLTYTIPQHQLNLQFHPTDFTQVNATLNRRMIDLALQLLDLQPEDHVLDLFCGLGNFSLPIARYCAQVKGIEGSERMVLRARMNAANNKLTNAAFDCVNLDDEGVVAEWLANEAVMARQNQSPWNKVLLDPPRTGALVIVNQLVKIKPDIIVYVSCNPSTLARDAGILTQQGYCLMKSGVMDMFPHTSHVESIALFTRVGKHYG